MQDNALLHVSRTLQKFRKNLHPIIWPPIFPISFHRRCLGLSSRVGSNEVTLHVYSKCWWGKFVDSELEISNSEIVEYI